MSATEISSQSCFQEVTWRWPPHSCFGYTPVLFSSDGCCCFANGMKPCPRWVQRHFYSKYIRYLKWLIKLPRAAIIKERQTAINLKYRQNHLYLRPQQNYVHYGYVIRARWAVVNGHEQLTVPRIYREAQEWRPIHGSGFYKLYPQTI